MSEHEIPGRKRMDGSFYAEGRTVFRAPKEVPADKGRAFSMGFPVCDLTEYCPTSAAQIIADALNAAHDIATPDTRKE